MGEFGGRELVFRELSISFWTGSDDILSTLASRKAQSSKSSIGQKKWDENEYVSVRRSPDPQN